MALTQTVRVLELVDEKKNSVVFGQDGTKFKVRLDQESFTDMGRPVQITVAIRPGYQVGEF